MKWLRSLFGFCVHKWKVISKHALYSGETIKPNQLPDAHCALLQCEYCGNLKKFII